MASFEKVRPYFERAAVVHLATLMPDGSPHSVPVWVGVEGDELAVFMIEGSRKDENLQRDPRAALSVTRPDEPLDMATVRGVVSRRIVGDEAMVIVDRISEAYTGAPYEERSGFAVFLIRPQTSWANDYTA
jgi:PPOX class probable F420-dependent enzyme